MGGTDEDVHAPNDSPRAEDEAYCQTDTGAHHGSHSANEETYSRKPRKGAQAVSAVQMGHPKPEIVT